MDAYISQEQLHLPRQWEGKLACLLHHVLSKKECDEIIKTTESKGFEPASFSNGDNRNDKADVFGNCSRCVTESVDLTDNIWKRIKPFVPRIWNKQIVVGLNERIRVLRYDTGENFHPHLDGSNIRENGDRSYLSVQVFLNEEFTGGSTTFLCMLEEDKTEVVPKTGSVLIFEHNILHEGSMITSGRKYLLRTDVMYSSQLKVKKSKLYRLKRLFKT